jgi:hypothetical protein
MQKRLTTEDAQKRIQFYNSHKEKITNLTGELTKLEAQNKKLIEENGDKILIEANTERISEIKKELDEIKTEFAKFMAAK